MDPDLLWSFVTCVLWTLVSIIFEENPVVFRSYSVGWRNQAFSFENGVESLKFGLVQNKGGPCGVLAVVQAFIIKVVFMIYQTLKGLLMI